jgi:hypothetical protein
VTASNLKPTRFYAPRIISDHIMVQEDFERLYKFLLETECLPEVSDDMRALIENEWPELVHKLPQRATKRLARAAPIVPQTAADPRPINMIAATKPTERNKPSASVAS